MAFSLNVKSHNKTWLQFLQCSAQIYIYNLLKIEKHWVTITSAQHKMYFAYLFFNCWNSENFNWELLNLNFFSNKQVFGKDMLNISLGIVSTNTSFPRHTCHQTMETPIPLYIDTHHCTIPNGWCVEMNH